MDDAALAEKMGLRSVSLAHCAASAWIKWQSSATCTCGEFFQLMRRITMKRARTWHYRKIRPCIEPSNDLAPLLPFRSWLDCTTNTSGYDFRKGQVQRVIAVRL
jgi:hypothetical protein